MKKIFIFLLILLLLIGGTNSILAVNVEQTYINDRLVLYTEPTTPAPEEGYPIIFLLHGALENPLRSLTGIGPYFRGQKDFTKTAVENGWIVIAPESGTIDAIIPIKAWDSQTPSIQNNTDLRFILDIIIWLETDCPYHTNTDTIVSIGLSSGGFMTSRIGYDLPDLFDCLISIAGGDANSFIITPLGPRFDLKTEQDHPDNHPPTLIISALQDPIVPYTIGYHYYKELKSEHLTTQLKTDFLGTHMWEKNYNDAIFDWINTYTTP